MAPRTTLYAVPWHDVPPSYIYAFLQGVFLCKQNQIQLTHHYLKEDMEQMVALFWPFL